jgi:hypothetical protein
MKIPRERESLHNRMYRPRLRCLFFYCYDFTHVVAIRVSIFFDMMCSFPHKQAKPDASCSVEEKEGSSSSGIVVDILYCHG